MPQRTKVLDPWQLDRGRLETTYCNRDRPDRADHLVDQLLHHPFANPVPFAPVIMDHPLSTLIEAEIEARAEQAVGQCVAVWRGK
jgi:hypothetical protein